MSGPASRKGGSPRSTERWVLIRLHKNGHISLLLWIYVSYNKGRGRSDIENNLLGFPHNSKKTISHWPHIHDRSVGQYHPGSASTYHETFVCVHQNWSNCSDSTCLRLNPLLTIYRARKLVVSSCIIIVIPNQQHLQEDTSNLAVRETLLYKKHPGSPTHPPSRHTAVLPSKTNEMKYEKHPNTSTDVF